MTWPLHFLNSFPSHSRLTCEALRKITKKFDKVAGSHMCKEVMERLWKSGFFQVTF